MPREPFTYTDREGGFTHLMGRGVTTLLSLIALGLLTFRRKPSRFAWSTAAFVLSSVVFDRLLITFAGAHPEPLVSAVRMGIDPSLFKGFVIGLILLQGWLSARFMLRHRPTRRAAHTRV